MRQMTRVIVAEESDFDSLEQDEIDQLISEIGDSDELMEKIDELVKAKSEVNAEADETQPETDEETEVQQEPVEQDESQEEDQEQVRVLTKDGKHEIPYAIYKNLKQKLANAEAELAKAQKQQNAPPPPRVDDAEAALKWVKEEYPELGEKFEQIVLSDKQRIQTLEERLQETELRLMEDKIKEVNEALDHNEHLRYLQAENPNGLWEKAIEIDNDLQKKAGWQTKPVAERFEEVVRRLQVDEGEFEVPEKYRTKKLQSKPAAPQVKQETIQEQRKADTSTLSDIAGGVTPNQNDELFSETSSVTSMAKLFYGKSAEEIDRILNRYS